MTLKNIIDKINNSGRTIQDATRKEVVEILDIVANDIMSGNTTILHANAIIAIRHSMMTMPERMIDGIKNESELSSMASALGRKGGLSRSKAKQKSSRENGKLGGRPRKQKPA